MSREQTKTAEETPSKGHTFEDETGNVNVIIWPSLLERRRRESLNAVLLAVYGTWQCEGEVRHPRLLELELAEATLKRWSSGTHCISDETYRAMVSALSDQEDLKPAWARQWAARVLNMIGYVGQHCERHARLLAETPYPRAAAPWPEYPFGYPCIPNPSFTSRWRS